ncbi:tyrosine-type recombinase/integrase [Psychromicrobium lacuslunae]|uniref:tyrosine-type recombinase/integrase n=1 Tax=Psychromicrobium lacuslunae TaxID=1618207 RepID=UPI000698E9F9|nr:site-specific integrase [Psychromicrobium lacuslunae]
MARRRSKGEGVAAYQTSDGRWRAEVNLGTTGSGARKRKTIYGASRAEVDAALRAVLNQRDQGIMQLGKTPTLIGWMDYYLENLCQASTRTVEEYKSKINLYLRPTTAGGKKLSDLAYTDFEGIYSGMIRKGLSSTTAAHLHRALSPALKEAVRKGVLAVNPLSTVKTPKVSEFEAEVIDTDDARRLIQAAEQQVDGVKWMVALALGLRQSERLALGLDQVNLETATLRVNRSLTRPRWQHGCSSDPRTPVCGKQAHWCPSKHSGGVRVKVPKSEAGKRTISLPQPIVKAFRKHIKAQQKRHLELGGYSQFEYEGGAPYDLVFCKDNGRPLEASADNKAWKAFLRSANVPEARLHDARHTAATTLLLMGVDGRVVMDILGWSQISMLNRYQHIISEMKQRASDAMTEALWQKPVETAEVIDFTARRLAKKG